MRENALNYFGDLAELLKEGIEPVFNPVLDQILETLAAANDFKKVAAEKTDGGFSLDTDSDAGEPDFALDLSALDEKVAAILCVGKFALHAPKCCFIRMPQILEALEKKQFYAHANARMQTSICYVQIAMGLARFNGVLNDDDKHEWKKGHPDQSPLPAQVTQFLETVVFPYHFRLFDEEDEKEVIERAILNMSEFAEELGPAAYRNTLQKTVEHIIKFLQKKATCQGGTQSENPEGDDDDVEDVDDDDDEEDEEDDDIDHDEIILGNIVDLINALAKAFGDHFAPTFQTLAPEVSLYTTDKHPKNDKNAALGCFAETFAQAPATIPPLFTDVLQLLVRLSGTKDSKMNRNVAYTIGVLAQHAPAQFQPHVTDSLALMAKLLANSEARDAKDNIYAAFCRIAQYQMLPLAAE